IEAILLVTQSINPFDAIRWSDWCFFGPSCPPLLRFPIFISKGWLVGCGDRRWPSLILVIYNDRPHNAVRDGLRHLQLPRLNPPSSRGFFMRHHFSPALS